MIVQEKKPVEVRRKAQLVMLCNEKKMVDQNLYILTCTQNKNLLLSLLYSWARYRCCTEIHDLTGISYLNRFTFICYLHSILPTFVMAAVGSLHLLCVAFVCPEVKPSFHSEIILLRSEIRTSWSSFSPGRF